MKKEIFFKAPPRQFFPICFLMDENFGNGVTKMVKKNWSFLPDFAQSAFLSLFIKYRAEKKYNFWKKMALPIGNVSALHPKKYTKKISLYISITLSVFKVISTHN